MSSWQKVSSTKDIPLGELRNFNIGNLELTIAHTQDGFYAFQALCTHADVELVDGSA